MMDPRIIAVAVVAAAGAALPFFLAPGTSPVRSVYSGASGPVAVASPAPLVAAYARPVFAAPEAGDTLPADAPDLVGIVGRLGDGAVALVRLADGSSRTLEIGQSVDGWRLTALAIDAASFTRGGRQIRVPLATEDAVQ
ncbi:hypothetical protein [Stakelama tenebrarum]|uniref:General secretion pathway protein GspC n=1 Tax=Stakelama tenebrarum TaxID=2711215 RepID=A0A6G6Y4B8_9SPHN|nr:hypothetical protein [Sphingosinithalassobacter tenebrarum]QIG79739.1 hypothetical protein G5C33_07975 [Sphingosinithalassobacter tenebrarum]